MDIFKKSDTCKDKKSLCARAGVARYSRGNVSLQNGRYVTEKEKQERKEKLARYKFI